MKRFADVCRAFRDGRAAAWLPGLAILALPWQTRFFLEAVPRGGQAWEQGRWSLFLSALPMIAAMVGSARFRGWAGDRVRALAFWPLIAGIVLMGAFLLPTRSWTATLQAMGQACVFAGFFWTAWLERDRVEVGRWLVYALLPVAVLALWQVGTQEARPSAWLGLAAHDPLVRGVSVVETAGRRFLRAYGSFPHPNVLGGWLAIGILAALGHAVRAKGRAWIVWFGTVELFLLALYATFSRSAWLALAFGGAVLAWAVRRNPVARRRLALGGLLVGISLAGAVAWRPDLVRTRVAAADRLERKSVDERAASLGQATLVLKAFPFGTGIGAYRVGLDRACRDRACTAPAEPPHLVPLLALAELGWARALVAAIGLAAFLYRSRRAFVGPCMAAVAVLGAFDHYLWSLWAGQALFVLALAVAATAPVSGGAVPEGGEKKRAPDSEAR